MNTATKIRKMADWRGDAALYRVDPPMAGAEYVVVSAIDTGLRFPDPITPRAMQIETYIFAADETGEPSDYQELPGSLKGTLDHADALRAAGYEVSA